MGLCLECVFTLQRSTLRFSLHATNTNVELEGEGEGKDLDSITQESPPPLTTQEDPRELPRITVTLPRLGRRTELLSG